MRVGETAFMRGALAGADGLIPMSVGETLTDLR